MGIISQQAPPNEPRRNPGGFWDMLAKYGQQQGGIVGMGAGMAADKFGPPGMDPEEEERERMRARGPQPGLAGGMGPGGGGGGGGIKSMMLRMLMGGG